jgi:hypothetical protein
MYEKLYQINIDSILGRLIWFEGVTCPPLKIVLVRFFLFCWTELNVRDSFLSRKKLYSFESLNWIYSIIIMKATLLTLSCSCNIYLLSPYLSDRFHMTTLQPSKLTNTSIVQYYSIIQFNSKLISKLYFSCG